MRIVLVSHDVVGTKMAGPGIRAHELGRQIAREHDVTLLLPRETDLVAEGSLQFATYPWATAGALRPWLAQADAIVANAHVLTAHPEVAEVEVPLALDLYDPIALENAAFGAGDPIETRRARHAEDARLFRAQLATGDFFFCATEAQRDLYLGALLAEGRLSPEVMDRDPSLRSLIDVVGFGLEPAPFPQDGAAIRARFDVAEDETLLLWTSGLWDWLDPDTAIRAMAELRSAQPGTRLLFLAGRHPYDGREMKAVPRSRELAASLGLLDETVFFHDEWIPMDERGTFLNAADIAICLHPEGPESHFAALRSRFLDHIRAGLPSLVSAGDAGARLVEQSGIGTVVAPGDVAAVSRAIGELSDDARRHAIHSSLEALRGEFAWPNVTAPLLRFCAAPHRQAERAPAKNPPPAPPADAPAVQETSPAPAEEPRAQPGWLRRLFRSTRNT